MKQKFAVTRQCYWGDGRFVVEIASGGIDYCNPDALVSKYPGEFEEFYDPREAVLAAISIYKAWKKDQPDEDIEIATGCTFGYTMPFEAPESPWDLRIWANTLYAKLPKCNRCGKFLDPDEHYAYFDDKYCSEYCLYESIPIEEFKF